MLAVLTARFDVLNTVRPVVFIKAVGVVVLLLLIHSEGGEQDPRTEKRRVESPPPANRDALPISSNTDQ